MLKIPFNELFLPEFISSSYAFNNFVLIFVVVAIASYTYIASYIIKNCAVFFPFFFFVQHGN